MCFSCNCFKHNDYDNWADYLPSESHLPVNIAFMNIACTGIAPLDCMYHNWTRYANFQYRRPGWWLLRYCWSCVPTLFQCARTWYHLSLILTLNRVYIVLTSLELRIHSKDYLQAHQSVQPCLQRLIAAANRCKGAEVYIDSCCLLYIFHVCSYSGVCVVNVLYRFGQLSGLSMEPFNLSLLESVPQMHSSVSDLLGDRQTKANWIQNVVPFIKV